LIQFLQQNAVTLILCFVYGGWGTVMAVMIVRHRRFGTVFPPLDPSRVRYREGWASARSHLSFWTRLGQASGCVTVVVTDDDVRVWLPFPFSVIAYEFDLEHCIPRSSITGLEEKPQWLGRLLLLDYTDAEGQPRRIELQLRRPIDFLKALNTKPNDPAASERDEAER
jgi:hypothetical protein